MKRQFLAASAAALALTFAQNASAQDVISATDDVTVLEPVYVTTPLRRETTVLQSTSTVTVISEADIQKSAARDLPSLLRKYPGVNIKTNGGQGASASVMLRSATAAQTLVLIDGMRVGSATTGTTYLSNIPLSGIQRVEIVEGAHSAEWGADAIGGVVNIITKDGSFCENGKNVCTTVEAGVTYPWGGFGNVNVRGASEDGVSFNVGLALLGTEGYDFTTPASGYDEPDRDGFLQGSFNYSISKDFDWGRLYSEGIYARSNPQYDGNSETYGASANDSIQTNGALKVGATIDHTEDWSSTFEVYSALDYARNFLKGSSIYTSQFNTVRYGLNASTQKTIWVGEAKNVLSLGGEIYREEVDATQRFDQSARNVGAIYGQYGLEWSAFDLNAGIRHDSDEQFGGATTYNIGLGYELIEGLKARASFGTGFRAPTFNELYYPGYANPDLEPERSRSWEAGLNWQPDAGTEIDMAVYQTFLRDMITSNASTGYRPFNVDKAKVSGIRATVSQALLEDRLDLDFGFEYRLPENETTDEYLVGQNRLKFTVGASYAATEKLNLNGDIEYVADRWKSPDLPEYTVVNVSALYQLDSAANVKFAVENLFNEDYETSLGYKEPGTTVTLGFSRTF